MVKGKGPGGRHETMRTYSPEEAELVHELVQEFAPQWTLIAKKVSDAFACERTAASVRNYYKRFEASKQTALRGFAKNRCQLCNQIKRGHICTPMQATPRNRTSDTDRLRLADPSETALEQSAGAADQSGFLALTLGDHNPMFLQMGHLQHDVAAAPREQEPDYSRATPPVSVSPDPISPVTQPAASGGLMLAAPPPPVSVMADESSERPMPQLLSARSLVALSASGASPVDMAHMRQMLCLPSPEDAAIPA